MNGTRTASRLDLSAFSGRHFAVLGLGLSGLSAATALRDAGAQVWAWDDNADRRAAARDRGIAPENPMDHELSAVDALVLSPGIPHGHPRSHPVIDRARAAGCEIVCDLELLTRAEPDAKYVGITGTNGKSTTTALIGHVLSELGVANAVGGNIGAPGLSLPSMGADGVYILEISSYQLELMPRAVIDIALLLNITPDHLDRHGGMDGYVAAKRRIFRGQGDGQTAIVGIDTDPSRAIHDELVSAPGLVRVPLSTREECPGGVFVRDGQLIDDRYGNGVAVLDLADLETLPGAHNAQNVAAAYAACSAVLGDTDASRSARIADAIRIFPGLAHRQELVGYRGGVRFVNDSKATNAEAAMHALAAYDDIYWIAGGIAKAGGIEGLAPMFGRIRHAFLIGQDAGALAATLDGKVPTTLSGDLATAVHDAAAAAADGATVLLSPACASFDQFTSFEARGDAFRAAVEAIDGFTAPGSGGTA